MRLLLTTLSLFFALQVQGEVKLKIRSDGTKVIVNTGSSMMSYSQLTLRPAPPSIQALIEKYSKNEHLETKLVQAVIQVESAYKVRAVSHKGAQGLMQLMPETAEELGVEDVFDAEENIRGGTRYLRRLLNRFGRLDLALAAYNAGPSAVAKYRGVPPYDETRRYVQKVLHIYRDTGSMMTGRAAFFTPSTTQSRTVELRRDASGRLKMVNVGNDS